MDKDELRSYAETLEKFDDWSGETVEIGVSITEDDYYFDLGTFGEGHTYVELGDDYYPLDVNHVLEKGPLSGESAREIAEVLREIAEAPEASEQTLDEVLARMQASGTPDEKWLARVLMGVADVLRGFPTPGAPLPLPAVPAPWPGALRNDIDYTAGDFPFRYQPPPGFKWVTTTDERTVDPTLAQAKNVEHLEACDMVLDDKGRVRYGDRADGAYENGARWRLWHEEHDGILCAAGFNPSDPPRALDQFGWILAEAHTEGTDYGDSWRNWGSEADRDVMESLLRARASAESFAPTDDEKGEEFTPPAPISV